MAQRYEMLPSFIQGIGYRLSYRPANSIGPFETTTFDTMAERDKFIEEMLTDIGPVDHSVGASGSSSLAAGGNNVQDRT